VNITKGLIIDDPWIGYILDGSKTWEMRSKGASHRGWFALIRKGTGAVWGVARLVDSGAPLSPDEMVASFDKHRIPADMIRSGQVAKWNTPWKLADVRKLASPVPYRHKSGAVTWVALDAQATAELARQLASLPPQEEHELPTSRPTLEQPMSRSMPEQSMPRPEPKPGILQRILQWLFGASKPKPAALRSGTPVAAAVRAAAPADAPFQPASPAPTPAKPASPVSPAANGRLIGEIEITQGNIDNNHIYLRSIFDRFPADAKGGSNKVSAAKKEIIVEWGDPDPVRTDLDGEKKFFRARGWIGRFYKLNQAKAGDKVRIEETAPYRYRVSLVR
jgi:hypothetical protein